MIVLGLDPGFASFGWAVVDVCPNGEMVLDCGVWRTQKSSKKRGVKATDDNGERARIIAMTLASAVSVWSPAAICAESMSFPRSSSVAAKMALAWGCVWTVAATRSIPVVQVTPQELKLAVCGRRDASKDDVGAAVCARVTMPAESFARLPQGQHEHAYDAIAAVFACLDSDVLRMARRMGAQSDGVARATEDRGAASR